MSRTSPRPALPGPVVVALDAGNSKTDAAVVRLDGTVLATVRRGGFRPAVDGLDRAMATVSEAVTTVLAAAGAPPVVLLAAYLANADLPVEEALYHQVISGWGMSERTVVGNDTLALLRSGAQGPEGVAVVCGAGINCTGLALDGRTSRFPALGHLTGDWGGGYGLANEVMWSAARSEDGRGPATALAAAVARHFGAPSAVAVAEAVHLRSLDAERLHELVPLLFEVASGGDGVARRLVARQAEEIGALVAISLTRLDLQDGPVDVVLGGGVLAAEPPLLMDDVRARVLAIAPRARITVPHVPPLVGALLLALDQVDLPAGSRAAALERVRTGYAGWAAGLVMA